jgi:hypothetical protein
VKPVKHPNIEDHREKTNYVTIASYVPDGQSQKRVVPGNNVQQNSPFENLYDGGRLG